MWSLEKKTIRPCLQASSRLDFLSTRSYGRKMLFFLQYNRKRTRLTLNESPCILYTIVYVRAETGNDNAFRMYDHVSGTHQRRMDGVKRATGRELLSEQGIEHIGVLVFHRHLVRDSVRLPDHVDRRVHRVRSAHQKHPGSVQRVQTHR